MNRSVLPDYRTSPVAIRTTFGQILFLPFPGRQEKPEYLPAMIAMTRTRRIVCDYTKNPGLDCIAFRINLPGRTVRTTSLLTRNKKRINIRIWILHSV
jgi:hypothetical protein